MKLIGIFIFGFLILKSTLAQQRKIYLAPDDHTDYMWSADEAGYRKAFLETLDYYIRLNDSTAGESYPYQSKWNCDGSYWVYEYQHNRSLQQFTELIDQIRKGKITVPLNSLPELSGIAPTEAIIRDMYYAGTLERRYGLDLDLVIEMEDQVLPLGLSSLWAGSGAKYSWRGVCDCATKVKGLYSRPNEIYWYKGLDDQKILMKWYSLVVNNLQLGGYAEARDPNRSVLLCKELMNSPKYPYLIAGAFGKGWDDVKTTTAEFLEVAKSGSDKDYQVIVSNETDFFKDFEQTYGSVLPSESVSYGSTEWGNSLASLAAVSSKVKRSVEKLRTAEALYTMVSLKDKNFATGLNEIRERAWISCGLYFDHDWTADGTVVTKDQRADWARKTAGQFGSYVDTLVDMSLTRLGELLSNPDNGKETFFVFNPLGWKRTDYCDYQYNGPSEIKIVDLTTANEVPFQFITRKNVRYVRILATDLPSLGYKIYGIRKRSEPGMSVSAATVYGDIIENSNYRIKLSSQGVITSLIDKSDNNHEYIRSVNGLSANDLGSADNSSFSPLRVENAGPVSVTLSAESLKPLKHISKITLFGFNDRIEIENYIEQNPGSGPVTYAFSFNLDNPEIHNEEAGAILKARQVSDGGHYADSICRLDWIAINHFAEMSDGNRGMILSNRDAILMKTGNSTVARLDPHTPQIKVLAAGQIDAPTLGFIDQDGDSYFENFFALRSDKNGFNPAGAMKFSMEHQNPLVAGRINGRSGASKKTVSMFEVSNPEVLVWALKPSEDGIDSGIIMRVWNMSDDDEDVVISSYSEIISCRLTSHIETDISEIKPESGVLKLKIGHNRIQTYRIFIK
ncbi:MAG: glycoside hydrolase [Bacteroidales bacterium]|nr:glycoside hydrolase [Bacteroidales bacterium]